MHEYKRILKDLDLDTAISVANAIASNCIDYCNTLLYGVYDTHFKKLQKVQNALACSQLAPVLVA